MFYGLYYLHLWHKVNTNCYFLQIIYIYIMQTMPDPTSRFAVTTLDPFVKR